MSSNPPKKKQPSIRAQKHPKTTVNKPVKSNVSARSAFIKALKQGRIDEAKQLKHKGGKLLNQGSNVRMLLEIQQKISEHLVSEQVEPDQLSQILSIKDMAAECGPFFLAGASFSLSKRPQWWARAASEDRIFSWHDQGFGLVGDQLVDIKERFIATRPLTRFRYTLITGPFAPPKKSPPEHLTVTNWEKLGLQPNRVNMPVFRNLLFELLQLRQNLGWIQQLGRLHELQAVLQELILGWSTLEPNAEFCIAQSFLRSDLSVIRGFLHQARQLDPAFSSLSELGNLHAMHRVFEAGNSEDWNILIEHAERRLRETSDVWHRAILESELLLLNVKKGRKAPIDDLEPFIKYLNNPERVYESLIIGQNCRAICENSWSDREELDKAWGGDPQRFVQIIQLGLRPSLLYYTWAIALRPGFSEVLSILLSQGVSPRGQLTHISNFFEMLHAQREGIENIEPLPGYFVPLAQAVLDGNREAVKALLDHGADPLEPSHFNDLTARDLASSEDMKSLFAQ
ncbi:MAG: hypothetical protein ABI042_18280 [Verrucomicrobiota bacterium]